MAGAEWSWIWEGLQEHVCGGRGRCLLEAGNAETISQAHNGKQSAEINTAPAGTDKQQPRHRCIGLRKHTYPRINRAKVTSDAPPWLFNDATVATGKKEGRSTVTPDSHTLAKRVSMVYDAPLLSFSASCLATTRTWSIVALRSSTAACGVDDGVKDGIKQIHQMLSCLTLIRRLHKLVYYRNVFVLFLR